MNEVKKIKYDEIPNGDFLTTINNSNLKTFIVPIIIGILMLLGNYVLKFFGALFIAFSLYVYFNFEKKKVVDVYKQFLVVYDPNDQDLVSILFWDNIKSWDMKVSQAAEDQIFVETLDDEYLNIYMFGIAKVAVYFRKNAFDKNKHEQFKTAENAKGSSFNIFNSFKKKG